MSRFKLLPHWCLTDVLPAFYDVESLTSVEQTARVYAAVQSLIDDYNKYVDEVNKTINEFIESSEKNEEEFICKINKIMHDYIRKIDEKIKMQDAVIDDAVNYMKTNLTGTLKSILVEMRENGELSEAIITAFEEFSTKLDGTLVKVEELSSEVEGLSTNVSGLSTSVESLSTSVDSMSNQVGTNINEISSLKADNETNKTDISELKADNETNKTDIANNRAGVNALNTNLSDLKLYYREISNVDLSAIRESGYFILGNNITDNNNNSDGNAFQNFKGLLLLNSVQEITTQSSGAIWQVNQTIINGYFIYSRALQISKTTNTIVENSITPWDYKSLVWMPTFDDYATIYGTIETQAEVGTGYTTIEYPEGFTKDNTIVISVLYDNGNGYYVNGYLQNGVEKIGVVLGDSINVSLVDSAPITDATFGLKIILMKIS